MAWPQAGDDQWVFIRRMQVSGPRQQLQRRLLEQTRHFLNQTENVAEVVRFDSLEALLAALLSDVLDGRDGFRWYWQNWAHLFTISTPKAVRQILSEHLVLLPSLTNKLAQRGKLQKLWQQLDESGSRQLAIELSQLDGFRLPASWELVQTYTQLVERIQHASNSEAFWEQSLLLKAGQLENRMMVVRLKQWQSILKDRDLSDSRFLLALVLIGRETLPLLMRKQPAQLLAILASCLLVQPLNRIPSSEDKTSLRYLSKHEKAAAGKKVSFDAKQSTQTLDRAAQFSLDDRDRLCSAQEPGKRPIAGLSRKNSYVNDKASNVDTLTDTGDSQQSVQAAEMTGVRKKKLLKWQLKDQSILSVSDAAFAHFHTTQGGLLYLLNMLNRTEMGLLMENYAEHLPSGWLWLYRLGQELSLSEDDPLVDFVAKQLGLESRGELVYLPALPVRDQVLDLAQRWYGKTDVWHTDLLALSAEIRYTPSHIDMYAAMTAIRLPVRLAGLDINPGWLPWLGKVVNFHYD